MSGYLNLFDHPDYVRAVRAGFFRRFPAFLHTTPVSKMGLIAEAGLEPAPINRDLRNTEEMLRGHPRRIVCFYPVGALLFPRSSGDRPFVSLAIARDMLPQVVGLDWSYYSIDNSLASEVVDYERIIEFAGNR